MVFYEVKRTRMLQRFFHAGEKSCRNNKVSGKEKPHDVLK
jgi:hypothetical protein